MPTLEDDRAIRDVLLRYCRGVDRLDLDLVRESYWPDAVDDHGAFKGGVEPFLEWIGRLLLRYDVTTHLLHNCLVEWRGEDDAAVETYGVAEHQTAGGPPELNLTIAFRYLDRFERRGGAWRIASRVCTTEWVRANPVESIFPVDARFPRGGRGGPGTDPVYDL